MNPRAIFTLSIIFFLLLNSKGYTLDARQEETTAPLFASEEPLKFTLIVDTRELKKDESDDPQYSDGQLILQDDVSGEKTFDIQVRARGLSRRKGEFCSFPPLKLNFKKKDVEGTVFDGQDKLKLVTYCQDLDKNESYILKEYLIYKFYNCMTPYSFNVRLAKITYKDINDKGKDVQRYGFLIEDDDVMAERNGGKISEILMSNHDRCERSTLDIFTIFQFMIGNLDWWIAAPVQHNVKVIVLENGEAIPVPYDFDYSGVVDASYAIPPEVLPVKSVRERYFRGYCRLPGTYELTVEKFNEQKECIYNHVNNFEPLDDRFKKDIIKYFDEFYEIVNDPKQLRKKVYDMCEINHKHLHTQ
jgi:hypothetical protein